jgi:hypothetical protein
VVEDGNPGWIKIKNRRYSQVIGRDELFEKRYEEKGAPEIGWDVCDRAWRCRRAGEPTQNLWQPRHRISRFSTSLVIRKLVGTGRRPGE